MRPNEKKMKSRGEKKVWDDIIKKSGDLKNVSSTQVGQQLLLDETLRVLPLIRQWIDTSSAHIYRSELQEYFTDDTILSEKLLQTYFILAGTIHNEFESTSKRRKKTRHKKINTLKKHAMEELTFDQVWRFTEVAIDYSQYFHIDRLLNYNKVGFTWNLSYTSSLSDSILEEISMDVAKAFYPLPMTEPPIDWSFDGEYIDGGYSDYQYELVRSSPRQTDYSMYTQSIFNAVNYIQSTPWKVNEDMLEVVRADIAHPTKSDFIKTPFPDIEKARWDVDVNENTQGLPGEELKKIKKARVKFSEKVEMYNADMSDYESALGKYRAIRLAIQIAEMYVGETIYFPHSYDFRGRIYPLPVGLSPQGSDAVKSLLLYANVEETTDRGMEWNWAYLASLYGEDKLDFDKRVWKGKELLWADYMEADEPYQFLAHQKELQKFMEQPDYVPNTRIHLDACNSGSQFTSAITGDRSGCLATNVIPTFDENGYQIRQDAYQLVSDKSIELCDEMILFEKDVERKSTIRFIKPLLEDNGRKICKVPVMVSNYGGTSGGRAHILWDMLRELQVDRKWITKKVAVLFSNIIGESIVGVLNGGKAFEIYIHKMNNIIAKDNQPIIWETSDGFHVVHIKNRELKSKQVTCLLPGARKKTTINKKVYSNDVSSTKMKSAISPNYIHSLDAELLRRSALKMKRSGIESADFIHDSFGCHPNHVDSMLYILKKEFSKMVKRMPLKLLDAQLRTQMPDTRSAQRALKNIDLPHLRGFDTARGDLDVVMDSEWFFS